MNIYIGGTTALQYWAGLAIEDARTNRGADPITARLDEWGLRLARVRVLAGEAPMASELRERLGEIMPRCPSDPHVLVADAASRRRSLGRICHAWSRPLPPGSFVRVGGGVFVSTPEFAFQQLAYGRDYAGAARLGYELCAAYVRTGSDARGFCECTPLTSAERIREYLASAGAAGSVLRRVRSAIECVADRSASPRETDTAIRLFAPRMSGGIHLQPAELNGRIDLPDGSGFYRCDFLWREQKVAAEYDSDAFHVDPKRHAADSVRRNALRDLGYSVVTITNGQYRDFRGFIQLGDQLAHALGRRRSKRESHYDWTSRYDQLYRSLRVQDEPWFDADRNN